ncbi:MAG TPA: HAD-IA family hydrolase, partial [Gammaproteobacteria bacterium]|nr:HAD-IA family hydrolase [Gammaproteobacteria bacterium]
MNEKRYGLLVFDWDGTLADSEQRIVDSVRRALSELGLPDRSPAQIRNIIGLGMQECLETLFPGVAPERHAGFIDAYRKHFSVQNDTPVTLFPGVKEVLCALDSRGYTIAIATGKSRRGLDRELQESGLDGVVQVSRCADESPSKPHPQMLEDILERTVTPSHQALMIGDTTYDMQMARDAGVDRVGVSYGAHEISRLLEFDPLEIVDSLRHFEQWLS